MAKQIIVNSENKSLDVKIEARSNIDLTVSRTVSPGIQQVNAGNNISVTSNGLGNVTVSFNPANGFSSNGNISAPFFIGNLVGNFTGNLTVPGSNTQVIYNNQGNAGANPNFTFNSDTNTVQVAGNIITTEIKGNLTADYVRSNLIPDANIVYDLGTSTNRFKDLYLSNSTIYVGNETISVDSNGLALSNTVTVGNLIVSGAMTGNASGLANITAANIDGQVANANIADTVYNNNQPNINSVGTLTHLDVNGPVTANSVTINTGATEAYSAAKIWWNNVDGTMNIGMFNNVTQQVGQELYFYGKAQGNITNGQVVMFAGVQGNHILIRPANASIPGFHPRYVIGIATQDINNGSFGYVTWFGKVNDVNTDSWASGTILYFDPSTIGGLTSVEPLAPNPKIVMCAVIKQMTSPSAQNGIFLVRPTFGPSINDIQDIQITSPVLGQSLIYNPNNNTWINGVPAGSDTAVTVTGNAQPNITSVGTLTSLNVSGDLNIGGNFTVTGNLIYANVTDLVIEDPLIYLAANNTGDTEDIGIIGNWDNGTYQHGGMARDHNDGTWKFFSNIVAEPTTVIDWANAVYDPVKMGALTVGDINSNGIITADGANLSNIPGANVTGIVANANHAGYANDVINSYQPNITSLGVLTSLTVDGNIYANVDNAYSIGNATHRFKDLYLAGNTLYLDTVSISVDANNDVNIGNFTVDSSNGTIYGNSINGDVAGANHSNVADVANSVSGSNVSGDVAGANHANVADVANSVALSNVVGIGNIASLNIDGVSSNILYGNGVFAPVPDVNNVANANYSNFSGEAFSVNASNIVGNVPFANLATYVQLDGNAGGSTSVAYIPFVSITTGNSKIYYDNTGGNLRYQPSSGTLFANVVSASTVTTANINLNSLYVANVANSNTSATISGTQQLGSANSFATLTIQDTEPGFAGIMSVARSMTIKGGNITASDNNSYIQINSARAMDGSQVIQFANSGIANISNLSVGISANLGANSNVKITGGTSGQILSTDGSGNLSWITVGSGTPAGSNTYVQFNDSNAFGASANFSFDKVNKTLTVDNIVANGVGLTSLTGANVTGTVQNAMFANTVVLANQPNITSLGTLTSLAVTGNITAGNVSVSGGTISASQLSGTGLDVTAANITNSIKVTNLTGGYVAARYYRGNNNSGINSLELDFANEGDTKILGNLTQQAGRTATLGSLTGLTVSNVSGVVDLTNTANVSLGNVSNLHISGGSNNYVLKTDGLGNLSWTPQTGGTGAPGGANTQLQFNDNGILGGISTATYDGSNLSLGPVANLKITGGNIYDVIKTDGAGNLTFGAIVETLLVGTRSGPYTVPVTNYTMTVVGRSGNITVYVN